MRTKRERATVVEDAENVREDKVYAEVRRIDDTIRAIYRSQASVYVATTGVAVIVGTDTYTAKALDDLPTDIRDIAYKAIFSL